MGPNTSKLFYRVYWTMLVIYLTVVGSSYYNASGELAYIKRCGKPVTDVCKDLLNDLAFKQYSMENFDVLTTAIVVVTVIALYQWYVELKEVYRQSVKKYKNKRNKRRREEA